jgi:superfamily II DNA/RNA helicase
VLRGVPTNRQTLLFSATLEGAVMDLAKQYTTNAVHHRLDTHPEQAPVDIEHHFVPVTAASKLGQLAETIAGADGLSLVFVRTTHGADRLALRLARDHDLRAAVLHGNMSQNARERSLAKFGSGKVKTLVATDVAARGLDVDHITHVINFDPPRTDEDYVHRVGRTGRAGRSGTGVTLVLPEQQTDVARLAQRLGHAHPLKSAEPSRSSRRRRQGRSPKSRFSAPR